ncbi:hypothetical protein A2U01_0104258, partial [Trifolium medium]|nr:hypothetical protein [Trifolium medium]
FALRIDENRILVVALFMARRARLDGARRNLHACEAVAPGCGAQRSMMGAARAHEHIYAATCFVQP